MEVIKRGNTSIWQLIKRVLKEAIWRVIAKGYILIKKEGNS